MIHRRALLATSLLPLAPAWAQDRKVRVGQATPAVSFLPMQAARALDTFPAQGIALDWANIAGDPACLAALDAGDIDLAAVGSETLLNAIGKGQPFQMVFSLMSKVTLQLVVSNAVIDKAGLVPADDGIEKRLAALKGLTIGVSAIGGTQDRAARWLAKQAGLDPRTGISVALAGPPNAIQGALEAGRIDGYVLSPPEGLITEAARTGQVLIRMGDEFPQLGSLPSLVLAAKTPVGDAKRSLLVAACKALQAACSQVLADPLAAGARIHAALYPRLPVQTLQSAVLDLKTGIEGRGRFEPAGIAALLDYAGDAANGIAPGAPFWTNEYWDAASA